MTVEPMLIERVADALWEAEVGGVAIAPVRDVLGTSTDIDAAYTIQQINT
jgi:2-keto-4-pentenoate hydratase